MIFNAIKCPCDLLAGEIVYLGVSKISAEIGRFGVQFVQAKNPMTARNDKE